MKTLIFGPAAVGKSSLMKAVKTGSDFLQVVNLAPTRGINREIYLFRGLLEISLWDLGGQEKYVEKYFQEGQRNRVFSEVKIPIFMVDAVNIDPLNKELLQRYLKNISEFSPEVRKVYVLINKTDLPNANPDSVYKNLIDGLDEKSLKMCAFTPVSVKSGTAQHRLIEILDEALQESTLEMQKLNQVRGILDEFKKQTYCDFFLFNRSDGLMISSTLGKIISDPLNFLSFSMGSLESNINQIFGKIQERLGKPAEPLNLQLVLYDTDMTYTFLHEIEDYAVLMIVSHDKNIEIIQKIQKIISPSNDGFKKLKTFIAHR